MVGLITLQGGAGANKLPTCLKMPFEKSICHHPSLLPSTEGLLKASQADASLYRIRPQDPAADSENSQEDHTFI